MFGQFCFKRFVTISISFLFLLSVSPLLAQQTVVSGKITDAETGDAIPFANVIFKNTSTGTTTNFEGQYEIATEERVDTLVVSYIGYIYKEKPVQAGITQVINFQLSPDVVSLQEVVFYAGENPAFEILRKLQSHRNVNDRKNLEAYEYESYTKTEIDINHLTEKSLQNKLIKKVMEAVDSVGRVTGDDGRPVIPVFLSETVSRMYHRNNPDLQRENVIKAKVNGVGLEADSWLSQLTGSSFQQYNFYNNWMNIVDKEFVSPIATTGRIYYEYELSDSTYVGNDFCYRIDFFPKSEQDLAFNGTLWITQKEYALRQIDVTVDERANLNYIDKIKIQQELTLTPAGAWLPLKTRVLIDTEEIGNLPGLLAKFYSSNRDFVVNDLKPGRFYETDVSVEELAYQFDSAYWQEHRHERLTEGELVMYAMIDTLNKTPVIRTYATIIDTIINGYKPVGDVDIGPYLFLYALNSEEGHRFRLGFRTNSGFSSHWVLRGYGAYGTGDQRFKYGAGVDFILSRTPWAQISVDYAHDLSQIGVYAEDLSEDNYIFYAGTFFGDLSRAYLYDRSSLSLFRQLPIGFSSKITLRQEKFNPLFNFAYVKDPIDQNAILEDRFTNTELMTEIRFARDEEFIQQGNRRVSLGTVKWPVVKARYTLGLENLLEGDFRYHKLEGSISQDLKMGFLGTSHYEIEGSYIFNRLPYPLLEVHLGNESLFYSTAAYNTMNRNEFISDHYVALHYQHHFQGFILNRIPLMKKLKWRLLASANVLYGGMREENRSILPETDSQGNPVDGFGFLDHRPFVEVGYGIENIFRIGRIDAFHRLTYLDNPNVTKFGIKISFQLIL